MTHDAMRRREIRIGDVYLVEFTGVGSEQQGTRPALVFQNNTGNKHSPNIIVLPMTSARKKLHQPTHVFVRAKQSGLMYDSVILCENPERVSKQRVGMYLTTLSSEQMKAVVAASLLATSAISFMDELTLRAVYNRAVKLNLYKN